MLPLTKSFVEVRGNGPDSTAPDVRSDTDT